MLVRGCEKLSRSTVKGGRPITEEALRAWSYDLRPCGPYAKSHGVAVIDYDRLPLGGTVYKPIYLKAQAAAT